MQPSHLLVVVALLTAFSVQILFVNAVGRLMAATRAWPAVFWLVASVVTWIVPITLGFLAGAIGR
ncbi:MAG: hypothetical protein DI527_00360 [Chelatococcus sp.]|nr:MAG: hypothetical protein DI527_00360 [Chelatococcus sp.]